MEDKLDHSLVDPNQMRHFGIIVQDNPYCRMQMYLSTEEEDIVIPLLSDGTVIYFSSRTQRNLPRSFRARGRREIDEPSTCKSGSTATKRRIRLWLQLQQCDSSRMAPSS
jgi:hypothetical protein